MNKVLVINNGSTSFRFKLFDTKNYNVLASGSIENMLKDNSYFKYTNGSDNIKKSIKINNFDEIISLMEELLIGEKHGVIDSKKEIDSIGYRVVHGGEKFNKSIIIDNKSLNEIKELCELMPLHGSKIVNSIEICSNVFPNSVPVAVFDTAFHSTIPKEIYLYAIPIEYYEKYGIRKYGFHGISYNYVFNRYLNITNTKKESYDGVICHLGGGSSLCAIKDGKSYDTTMEFTPSSGMIMASRVGNIDPIALFYIMQKENKSIEEIIDMMNKYSGYKALCNDTDMKSIVDRSENNDADAILTRRMIEVDFKKNLLSMMANLDRVDSIIFTGGIGTKNKEQREMLLQNLSYYGIEIDRELNNKCFNNEMMISRHGSRIPVYVIPDDEEKEIASECVQLIKRRG